MSSRITLQQQVEKLLHAYLTDRLFHIHTSITPFYENQFLSGGSNATPHFTFDYLDLLEHNAQLCGMLQDEYYQMEGSVKRAVRKAHQDWMEKRQFKMGKMMHDVTTANTSKNNSSSSQQQENFAIGFRNMPQVKKIRDLRTRLIGKLVTIQGTVTRTSEVLPELIFGKFQCLKCGTESASIEQQFKFTQPNECQNPTCDNHTKWQLDMNNSTFADWQRVRVQENQNEIPSGSMPRCIDIILRNSCVERAKAGDKAKFSGTLLVVPDVSKMFYRTKSDDALGGAPDAPREDGGGEAVQSGRPPRAGGGQQQYASEEGVRGLKSLGVRDLGYKLCFLSNYVELLSGKGGDGSSNSSTSQNAASTDEEEEEARKQQFIASLTVDDITKISDMKNTSDIYDKLVRSIAPNIYGHEDVKKGILLMMFGGVHKETQEGINLRGDLNVCIVGDPGTAKSQFLKYISAFLPRAVYTSGKASSAAGLTATVVKDNERGEFTIEAGALMLADNGVCCIDEFDKMDEKDQVAIHEAMEQQTISIAKAGIRATLNARTSILAAANPIGGRYNPRKTLRANLNISPPIMSRFDLFFVVRDECKESADRRIADHIIKVHRGEIEETDDIVSTEDIKLYLQYCRLQKPQMSREAKEELVAQYKTLRQQDKSGSNAYRITVRQLESMIRLSEALARLHCADRITVEHVKEAVSLLSTSITKVQKKMAIRINNRTVEDDDDEFARPQPRSNNNRSRSTIRLVKMTQQKIEQVNDKLTTFNIELTKLEEKLKALQEAKRRTSQNTDSHNVLEDENNRQAQRGQRRKERELHQQIEKHTETVAKLREELQKSLNARRRLKESTRDEKVLEYIRKCEGRYAVSSSLGSESDSSQSQSSKSTTSSRSSTRKKFQLTVPQYRKISKLLIEELVKRGEEIPTTRNDLITYYVSLPANVDKPKLELSEKQLKKVLSGVIDRMLKDKVLLRVPSKDGPDLLVKNANYNL